MAKKKKKEDMALKDDLFDTRKAKNVQVDEEYGKLLLSHMHNPVEIVQNPLVYVKRLKMTRLFTLYELFKPTIELPGDIVELGVFKGESLLSFAKMLEAFCMGDRAKKLYGFDHFRGLQDFGEKDGREYHDADKRAGGWCGGDYYDELKKLIELYDADRFVPMKERIVLVEGDVLQTIPKFVEDNPGIRISLLHFDLDLYGPTMTGLEHFYDKVVNGGVIIFDEYGLYQFQGETAAADEFFAKRGIKPKLRKFNWYSSPVYMIKGEE